MQVEDPVGPGPGLPGLRGRDGHPHGLRLASAGLPARLQTQGETSSRDTVPFIQLGV